MVRACFIGAGFCLLLSFVMPGYVTDNILSFIGGLLAGAGGLKALKL